MDLVEDLLAEGKAAAMLGPLLHNPQVVASFEARGVRTVDSPDDIPPGYTAVIRAHGIAPDTRESLERRGCEICDATCPSVAKIHRLVEEATAAGNVALIAGDCLHPEVVGIVGYCRGACHVFSDSAGLENLLKKYDNFSGANCILLSQTTFHLAEWKKCAAIAENYCTNIKVFDTMCNATVLRQQEAELLAQKSDVMVVVGGRGSSNTAKLAGICGGLAKTVWIESPAELNAGDFAGRARVGITAGASTPAFIIKEVQTTMSDIMNAPDELSFEQMLEQSLKTINSREKVSAVVTSVSPNEIAVDIGTKHAGYVPLHEFTDDPNARLDELVKVGDRLELIVLRVNDVEGTAMLSKKRLDAIAGFEKVMEAETSGEILDGVVVDVVKGGVIALANSVRVFIPASQATASRNQELETLLKQPVQFKILEVNRQRRRAVGSIRAVLKEQRKAGEEKFWADAEVGKTYHGTVKSLTSYGAFIDIGGVDGMVHISELSWGRVKHPSEVLNVGDVVEVYIKDIDQQSKKISLGYKKTEDNPWEILARDFKTGDVIKAKVVSMTPFGAFAQIIPGVDGLIHISQISNQRVAKPGDVLAIGQEVDVKITDIEFEKKRVSLSIRALLDEEPVPAEEPPVIYEVGPETAAAAAADPEPAGEEVANTGTAL